MFPLTPDQHHWLEVATEDEGWCSFTSCTPSRSRARTSCWQRNNGWRCILQRHVAEGILVARHPSDATLPSCTSSSRMAHLHLALSWQSTAAECTRLHWTSFVASEQPWFEPNPVDYIVWGALQQMVYWDSITSLNNLKEKIQRCWAELSQGLIDRVVDQWRPRLHAREAILNSRLADFWVWRLCEC